MVEEEKQGRFSRWSKRKLDAKSVSEELEEIENEALVQTDEELDEDQQKHEEMLLANREAAEAVDLEAIDKDSDLSVFMKEGVPDLLKKKAMHVMWRSSPVFANVDGLCDYDDDFGSPDLNMKVFKSAYQVGRGYLEVIKEKIEITEEFLAEDKPVEKAGEGEKEGENLTVEADEVRSNENELSEENLIVAEVEEIPDQTFADELVEGPVAKISLRQRLALD